MWQLAIFFSRGQPVDLSEWVVSLSKVLCNTTTIQDIYNSIHFEIGLSRGRASLPPNVASLLEMNRNRNKPQVIRQKILQYCFVGKFDMEPFVGVDASVSVLPELMSLIGGDDVHSATYIFLRCVPELCEVSKRKERAASKTDNPHKRSLGKWLFGMLMDSGDR